MPSELGGDFRFQGQWLESNTDFYHMRARYYDPEVGRFISRDPVDLIETEPESSNPYQFVYNNPLIYSDPTGMFTLAELNTSMRVQDSLNKVQAHAVNETKDYLVDRAQGILGDIVSSAMNQILPSYWGDIATALNEGRRYEAGDIFGLVAENVLSPLIGNQLGSQSLWLTPRLLTSGRYAGQALNPGYTCGTPESDRDDGRRPPVGETARPDYIISSYPPTDNRPGHKDLLIGDFKISANTLHDQYVLDKDDKQSQWNAIAAHAR